MKLQKFLDTHTWSAPQIAEGSNGQKTEVRRCSACGQTDDPRTLKDCTKLYYCPNCEHAASRQAQNNSKCPDCKGDLTDVPAFTVPLPTN